MDKMVSVNLFGLIACAIMIILFCAMVSLELHNSYVEKSNKEWDLKLNYNLCLSSSSPEKCAKQFGMTTTYYNPHKDKG